MSDADSETCWAWENEAFVPCHQVPVGDRGFRYGMHLFETTRFQNGRILLLQAHLNRWQQDAKRIGLVGTAPTVEDLESHFAACQDLPDEAVLRFYWTAGPGAPGDAPASGLILLQVQARRIPQKEEFQAGWEVDSVSVPLQEMPPHAGLKTGNYWENHAALEAAKRAGFRERLRLSPDGSPWSFCMGNCAWWDGEAWLTPGTLPFRAGTVREWLLSRNLVQIVPASTVWTPEDCRELVHLNSFHGVMPVSRLGSRSLETGVGMRLHRVFEEGVWSE